MDEKKLLAICERFKGRSPQYYVGAIPEPKARKVRETLGIPGSEPIFALVDFTVFGSAADSLVVAKHGIYWGDKATPRKLRWSRLAKCTIREKQILLTRIIVLSDNLEIWEICLSGGVLDGDRTVLDLLTELKTTISMTAVEKTEGADLLGNAIQTFTVCPSCGGGDWKSAKLIVLENTTDIEGDAEGAITDPGRFSGGVREFLLSDRWFSWDNPIDLRLRFTSTTGLVEEIKRFMLTYSSLLASPWVPIEPDKKEFYRNYRKLDRDFRGANDLSLKGIWNEVRRETKQMDRDYERVVARYRKELDEYEVNEAEVRKQREQIWRRARVCMRCGECYLGKVET